jgi:hypothetical protein
MKLSDLHAAYGLTVSIGYRTAAQRVDVYFPKDALAVPVEIEAGPRRMPGTLKLEKFVPDNPTDEWDMEISLNVPEVHEMVASTEPEAAETIAAPEVPVATTEEESSFLASPVKASAPASSFTADAIPFDDEVEEQEGEPVFTEESREALAREEKAMSARINAPIDAETLQPPTKPIAPRPIASKPAPKKAPKG